MLEPALRILMVGPSHRVQRPPTQPMQETVRQVHERRYWGLASTTKCCEELERLQRPHRVEDLEEVGVGGSVRRLIGAFMVTTTAPPPINSQTTTNVSEKPSLYMQPAAILVHIGTLQCDHNNQLPCVYPSVVSHRGDCRSDGGRHILHTAQRRPLQPALMMIKRGRPEIRR